MLVREDGSTLGTVGGGCVEADVWAAAKEVMQKEAPRKMVFHLNNEASYDNGLICGGTVEVFVEPILPQPLLYLFGGGHVSTAVARAAASFASLSAAWLPPSAFESSVNTIAPATAVSWIRSPNILRSPDNHGRV